MSSSTDITAAKIAIRETLYRYSLMVDGRRWDMIDEVFTDDAVIDYTSVGWGATRGAHREMLKWLDSMLEPWPMNQHLISNEIITIDGQSAKSTCCFNAPMGCSLLNSPSTTTPLFSRLHQQLI